MNLGNINLSDYLSGNPLQNLIDLYQTKSLKIKAVVALVVCVIFVAACTFFSILPLTKKINTVKSELKKVQEEQMSITNLGKQKETIEKQWKDKKDYLEYLEKQFVTTSETATLLENISKLAQDSGFKINSLRPADASGLIMTGDYKVITIKLTASAGTHQIGAFLAKLESGMSIFKIRDLKIAGDDGSERSHQVEVSVEAYRKVYS